MKELLRSTDPVRLSWVSALLAGENIEVIILDTHMSFADGSVVAIPRRVMVADEDFEAACRLLSEAGELDAGTDADRADTLLGGAVRLRQPRTGYRVAIDPVLLAASVPAASAGRLLDVGTGAGAAALCYARRVPGASVAGLELQPDFARLARENVELNGLSGRVEIVEGDLLQPPESLVIGSFDHVIANPPYLPQHRADPPPQESKASANVEGATTLADWLKFALAMVRPKGGITFIHRADRLDDLLALLHHRAGGIVVFPLWPKAGREAKRVIVRARPGVRTPMRLGAGLVLHNEDGSYTARALAVLRDGEALTV